MALFDGGSDNLFDLSNPTMMALLGALGGLGKAAAPSRLPVTNGQVWGSAAEGLLSGAKAGQEQQGLNFLNELRKAQAQEAQRKADVLGKFDLGSITGGTSPVGGIPAPANPLAPVLPSQGGANLTPRTTPNPGHINFGGTGRLGDPRAPGWDANLTNVKSPSGAGFQVHQSAAADVANFLKELEDTGYKIDPGTSGGYNLRDMTNNPGTLSEHAYGTAFDINSKRNPYSAAGHKITDLPENIGEIAARHNLEWGGNWTKPSDPMHFQWRGPQVAQASGGTATDATPGAPPLAVPPGAGAANVDPVALARQRAILGLGGIAGDPLAGFAQAYYNSPQYKGTVAGVEAGAAAGARHPFDTALKAQEADLQRRNQLAAQGMTLNEQGAVVRLPNYSEIQAQMARDKAAAERSVIEPSDVRIGAAGRGYNMVPGPQGGYRQEPIPGSPQAIAEQEKEGAKNISSNIVTQDIDRALGMTGTLTTGLLGSKTQGVWQPSRDLAELLTTLRSSVGFETLRQMKAASPTGGALGPVSDTENKLLQSTLGSIDQSQSKEQLDANLRRLRETFQDVVHGNQNQLARLLGEGKITQQQYDVAIAARAVPSATPAPGVPPGAPAAPKLPTGATQQKFINGKWYYELGGKVYPHQ